MKEGKVNQEILDRKKAGLKRLSDAYAIAQKNGAVRLVVVTAKQSKTTI